GRVVERLAEHEALGLLDVGNDALLRLLRARAETGERERRAHELEEVGPIERRPDACRLARELVPPGLDQSRRLDQLGEAPPERATGRAAQARANLGEVAHRWHVVQLVRVWTSLMRSSSGPDGVSSSGDHAMSNTLSTGRT